MSDYPSNDIPDVSDSSRPVTSKPRGVCRYYQTDRGCYAGDRCKFLHGQRLTLYDKNKVCRFYAAGWCKHGDKCWFIHALPPKPGSSATASSHNDDDGDLCSICYEKPDAYGLLMGCSHVFCMPCIKNWRNSQGKSTDILEAGTTKTCPMCRASSRFVTPSTVFYAEGDSKKHETAQKYKASMARIKCKHFEKSPANKRFCPFGKECFYKHENEDGTPYVFDRGADYYMERRRNQREYDDIGFGVLENNRGTGFEALLLSRMNRLFSSGNVTSRDMQRAILSSFAAAVGAESLPPMFLLDEESAEEEEDEDVEVVISAPESHTATTEGPLPVPFSTDEAATSSSLPTSTSLDPTSPVFVPSYLDSLRPLPPGPSADPDADDDHPDSRSVVDNIITSPAPYLWNAGDILRDWAERHPPSGESSSSTTVVSAAPEAPSSSSAAQAEEDSQAAVAGVVHDSDPPFMTDGRGRVVWSSTTSARAREGRRGRATSSSATIVPHIKSSPDMSTASEESSDDTAQHHSHRLRPSSLSGRLVRQRSLPLVGSNDDAFELSAEFVTDGRGRVVFANKR